MMIQSLSSLEQLWLVCEHCGNNFYTSQFKTAQMMGSDLLIKWCSKDCMKKEYDERHKKNNDKKIKASCWVTEKQIEYGP